MRWDGEEPRESPTPVTGTADPPPNLWSDLLGLKLTPETILKYNVQYTTAWEEAEDQD